ncbi:MAG: DUF3575 domain-containing protein [Prevotella sp.]
MRIKIIVAATIMLIAIMPQNIKAQKVAVKTNLLYDATTTPNLGLEARLSEHWTTGLNFALNPWTFSDNKKLKHLLVSPQARYWTCETFTGHFFGANLAYVHYNICDIKFPFGLYGAVEGERRQGDLAALGGSYGYSWILSPHWSFEAEAGIDLGYAWSKVYDSQKCGSYRGPDNKFVVLPRIALSFVYHGKMKVRKPCRPVVYEPMVVDTVVEPAKPVFVPVFADVPDNTGKAGVLEADNPVLQHISHYRPYDNTRILRKEKGALYVHFPLNKSTLSHDFRDNAATLDRIVSITRQIMADSTSSVKLIQIIGLASPEGSVSLNNTLAGERAEALKDYVQQRVEVADSLFELCNGGEAWTELRDQIADSNIDGRDAMISIIDTEKNPDRREQQLKRLDGGRPYKYLKDNILSDQRNSGYLRIYYDYVPDEAARTINHASALLREERYAEALVELRKVESDPRAQNALGVALYMTGSHDEALRCFRRAADSGNEEARRNLNQLEQ